jgi:O-antigen/teichoic acid export membrane protein
MADNLKEKTINGVVWSAVDRFSSQGIQFVFNILIARVLLPDDYGVVAMLSIFMAVAQAFIDSGFGNALIRKPDKTDVDYDTVFHFNLTVSILFCVVLWFTAPLIAKFYGMPLLTKVTRIICFTLVINALGAVQQTRLSIALDFRKKAIISIVTITVIGAVGLWMALKGYGVWALVTQGVVGAVVKTLMLWLSSKWHPRLRFSLKSFKEMFSFGSRILATGLIDTVWGNLYNIVIGKCFSPAALGTYNRAESFATFPSSNIYGLVQSVLYPSLCKIQDDTERLKNGYRMFVRLTSFVVFPMMLGLAAVADPFIRVILTDTWEKSIPLLQLLCFSLVLYPLSAINITFPNILGHSELYLRNVMINKGVDLVVLVATVPLGLTAMCIGKIISSAINLVINTIHTRRLLGYGFLDQMRDLSLIILSSVVMGLLVITLVRLMPSGNLVKLCVGILAGVLFYVIFAKMFMKDEFKLVSDLITGKLKKNG